MQNSTYWKYDALRKVLIATLLKNQSFFDNDPKCKLFSYCLCSKHESFLLPYWLILLKLNLAKRIRFVYNLTWKYYEIYMFSYFSVSFFLSFFFFLQITTITFRVSDLKNLKWCTESKDSCLWKQLQHWTENGIGQLGRSGVSPVGGQGQIYTSAPLLDFECGVRATPDTQPRVTSPCDWNQVFCTGWYHCILCISLFVHSLYLLWFKTTAVMRIRLASTLNLYLKIDFAWKYKYLVH